jgi:hypothetical protein
MISQTTVCLAQTVHQTFTNTNTIFKWTTTFHMTHVIMEFHRVRLEQFLRQWYVRRKQCTYLASRLTLSPHKLNQASTCALSPGVPSNASKMISKPTVCSAQTVHLSCTDTNNISKRTKPRFHMTHVTLQFHQVHPNDF